MAGQCETELRRNAPYTRLCIRSVVQKKVKAPAHNTPPKQATVTPARGYPCSSNTRSIARRNNRNKPQMPPHKAAAITTMFRHHLTHHKKNCEKTMPISPNIFPRPLLPLSKPALSVSGLASSDPCCKSSPSRMPPPTFSPVIQSPSQRNGAPKTCLLYTSPSPRD